MEPYGSKHFKTLLLLQITAESFSKTSPKFSSQWNFENWNFNDFFLFSLTWNPIWLKISKKKKKKKAITPTNFSQKVWNLWWIPPPPLALTKLHLGYLNVWKLQFYRMFSSADVMVWGWWCPTVCGFLQPFCVWKFPVLTKGAYRKFEISNYFVLKDWKLTLWQIILCHMSFG